MPGLHVKQPITCFAFDMRLSARPPVLLRLLDRPNPDRIAFNVSHCAYQVHLFQNNGVKSVLPEMAAAFVLPVKVLCVSVMRLTYGLGKQRAFLRHYYKVP
jgi:hypothetical protein